MQTERFGISKISLKRTILFFKNGNLTTAEASHTQCIVYVYMYVQK